MLSTTELINTQNIGNVSINNLLGMMEYKILALCHVSSARRLYID